MTLIPPYTEEVVRIPSVWSRDVCRHLCIKCRDEIDRLNTMADSPAGMIAVEVPVVDLISQQIERLAGDHMHVCKVWVGICYRCGTIYWAVREYGDDKKDPSE